MFEPYSLSNSRRTVSTMCQSLLRIADEAHKAHNRSLAEQLIDSVYRHFGEERSAANADLTIPAVRARR